MFFSEYSRSAHPAALALTLALALPVAAVRVPAQQAGFYHAEPRQGVWWMIDPQAQPGLVMALNHVRLASSPNADLSPARVDERSQALVQELRQAGFNTFGGDTDADVWHRGLAFVMLLNISQHLEADRQTRMVDVYDPQFENKVRALVEAACAPRIHDRDLVGYFSDDGLDWDPATHPASGVLTYYLSLPAGSGGRDRVIDTLRERYGGDIAKLNRAWGVKARDFLELTAPRAPNAAYEQDAIPFVEQMLVRYFQVVADAIHDIDPNHLDLGADLDFRPSSLAAMSIADVVSIKWDPAQRPAIAAVTKPVLLSWGGCGSPSAGQTAAVTLANVVGWVWKPAGDWETPA